MPYKSHAILEVDSSKRSSGHPGDFKYPFNFGGGIHFKISRQYCMRIENIRNPHTLYDINASNNSFVVEEDNGVVQVNITATVPVGNYVIGELLSELKTKLDLNSVQGNLYTLTADDPTGKITVSFTGGSTEITVQSITLGSTMNKVLGFEDALYPTVSKTITSPNHMNLSTIRYLNIETDIVANNAYTRMGQRRIGVKVPITALRSSIQLYENHMGPMMKLTSLHTLHNLDVVIRDAQNTILDFNGVDVSFDVIFYEYRN